VLVASSKKLLTTGRLPPGAWASRTSELAVSKMASDMHHPLSYTMIEYLKLFGLTRMKNIRIWCGGTSPTAFARLP
jgi:hypothetical protein